MKIRLAASALLMAAVAAGLSLWPSTPDRATAEALKLSLQIWSDHLTIATHARVVDQTQPDADPAPSPSPSASPSATPCPEDVTIQATGADSHVEYHCSSQVTHQDGSSTNISIRQTTVQHTTASSNSSHNTTNVTIDKD